MFFTLNVVMTYGTSLMNTLLVVYSPKPFDITFLQRPPSNQLEP